MEWRPYGACCRLRALEPDRPLACPDCGHVLLRCSGFDEGCRQLLGPGDACPVHLAPRLSLPPGAVLRARVGERVVVPLLLRNDSGCGAALEARGLEALGPGGAPVPVALPWERLPAGEERELAVETGVLEAGGSCRLELRLRLAASPGGFEEEYLFAAGLLLQVEAPRPGQVVQNISITGSTFAAGATGVLQTGPTVQERVWGSGEASAGAAPGLRLERAEALELAAGLRGYTKEGYRIHPDVELLWAGFAAGEAPPPGRPFLARPVLRGGRNSCRRHEQNPEPNDFCLRAYAPGGAEPDRERTAAISGFHCELLLRNDRLHLRGRGRNGPWCGGKRVAPGAEVVLHSGDRIHILEPGAGGPELGVAFAAAGRRVERIVAERVG